MTTTIHLDRLGYVVEAFHSTRIAQLDANRYAGTLMEVTGPVTPGMRWDGQRFVLPPARVPPEAVADERKRRIETYFPERFREQVTALGGDNAKAMYRYLSEVHKVAEAMALGDPPRDYKDDRHWPTPPVLADLPQPVHETVSSVSQHPVTIAPVFNVAAPSVPEAQPIVIQKQASPEPYGLDASDPLYHQKLALIRSIEAMDEQGGLPASIEPDVTAAAVLATAAQSLDEFNTHKSRVHELMEAV